MKKNRDHLFKHSKERILQRYDVELSRSAYEKMCDSIRHEKPNALFLIKESNTRTHWLIDDKYIAVYHTKLKAICTFRPANSIWDYLPSSDHFKIRKYIKGWVKMPSDDE